MFNMKFWIALVVTFVAPICIVTALSWDSIKPYLIVDAETAKGKVIYFYMDS